MKKNLLVLSCLVVSGIALAATTGVFNLNSGDRSIPATRQERGLAATETFAGSIGGKSVIFEHRDYARYKLTVDGVSTEGPLNTERGFGEDADATVFVLDWQKPVAEQAYFVRLTRDPSRLKPLDGNRTAIPGELLRLRP